jgi:3-phenylpropionate/cinnamic acid dioxygenase small subunit
MFEAHRYRHLIGPAQITKTDGNIVDAHANFFVTRIMHTGDTTLFATGRYLDRIAIGQPYRFIERLVVLDSQKIDTLIAIPL